MRAVKVAATVEAVVPKLTFKEYLLESVPLSNLINDEVEKEEKAANECKIINTYNRNPFTAKRISMIDINDPIFEKPIKN